MQFNTLKSAIYSSRKQASRIYRKLSPLKYFPVLAALVVSTLFSPPTLSAQGRVVSPSSQTPVDSYIVKETGTQTTLMAKDVDHPVSPASLTKILTCIMAIESGRLEQDVLITKESTMVEPSKAGFMEGDRIKLIDLVRAAMVSSSNDAAFAIAIYLSGNVESFVASMNYKAKMIGMKNSFFTNPAGYDKGTYAGNISTAGDLMRLTEYSVRNPLFNQVARLEKVTVAEQTSKKVYWLRTHNKLLDRYPYAVGIKTGYTCKAGGCLIARAIKGNKDLLLVMLNARNRWDIASNMFDAAFSANSSNPVVLSGIFRSSAPQPRPLLVKKSERQEKKSIVSIKKRELTLKKQAIAKVKSGRHSKKLIAARLMPDKRLKKEVIAELKSRKKLKKHAIAESKSKVKRRQLVSLKPVKKAKKRVNLS
ncbi:MAG: D-alanyl-D-alanine carboxypeptidase [Chlorobium sp.]|jgi:D-alanyl-D-alanine carboxypeptidase (penicillin-binding protein 5/6)|nr:D-alanyl-D-alanine carboxypeptidase [Chlorobium sp.]